MCSTNKRPSSTRSIESVDELNSGEITPTTSISTPLISPSNEPPHPFYDYKQEKAHLHVSKNFLIH